MLVQLLNDRFPPSITKPCINTSSERMIGIYDDDSSWCVINSQKKNFTIYNPGGRLLYVVALDKCCLDGNFAGKRCDFSIMIPDQALHLVEIKDTKPKNKRKPVEQLENTIKHFISQNLIQNFNTFTAIISWRFNPPRPLTNSSQNTARVRFRDLYGFELKEGNTITV